MEYKNIYLTTPSQKHCDVFIRTSVILCLLLTNLIKSATAATSSQNCISAKFSHAMLIKCGTWIHLSILLLAWKHGFAVRVTQNQNNGKEITPLIRCKILVTRSQWNHSNESQVLDFGRRPPINRGSKHLLTPRSKGRIGTFGFNSLIY